MGMEDSSEEEEDEDESEPPKEKKGDRLLWAAQFGRMDVMEELLEEDAALMRHTDEDGYTALHRAAYSGHEGACQELLRRGADAAARTEDGWTALHSACRWNRADCAEALLAAGADANARTNGGQTPLHLAAYAGKARETLEVRIY